jgi:hypothetical protein
MKDQRKAEEARCKAEDEEYARSLEGDFPKYQEAQLAVEQGLGGLVPRERKHGKSVHYEVDPKELPLLVIASNPYEFILSLNRPDPSHRRRRLHCQDSPNSS